MSSAQIQTIHKKLALQPLGADIREFLDYLTIEAGLSGNTVMGYGRDLVNFAEFCRSQGVQRIEQITAALIQQYLRYLTKSGNAESSINRGLVAIKMLLRFLFSLGKTKDDFLAILEGPKMWQRLPFVCSKEKVFDLLAAPDPSEGST